MKVQVSIEDMQVLLRQRDDMITLYIFQIIIIRRPREGLYESLDNDLFFVFIRFLFISVVELQRIIFPMLVKVVFEAVDTFRRYDLIW